MTFRHFKTPLAIVIGAVLLSLAGCDQIGGLFNSNDADAKAQKASKAPRKMPLPVVDVLIAQPQTVTRTTNLPARLAASRKAIIVPRVSGIVEKRLFEEGAMVKAGQLLYQLDKGTFVATLSTARGNLATANARIATSKAALKTAQANLHSAKASVGQSIAQRDLAKKELTRYNKLIKSNAISQQQLDGARSNLTVQQSRVNVSDAQIATANAGITSAKAGIHAANAAITSAQAGVDMAKINLGYTEITSPIDGVIGLSKVTEGAYVKGSQTQMAEIQQLDPLYVNITQPASAIMQLRKAQQAHVANRADDHTIQLVLSDGSVYPYKGRLLFVNQAVNESTGEMTVRAEIPNPDGELIPGLYVRVNVPQDRLDNVYLIPQQAITRGKVDTVMVVEADGSYHPLPITVGGQTNQDWIVTGGLKPGTTVIVDGMEQLAIKMRAPKVQTRPWQSGQPVVPQQSQSVSNSKVVNGSDAAQTSEVIGKSTTSKAEPRKIELIGDETQDNAK